MRATLLGRAISTKTFLENCIGIVLENLQSFPSQVIITKDGTTWSFPVGDLIVYPGDNSTTAKLYFGQNVPELLCGKYAESSETPFTVKVIYENDQEEQVICEDGRNTLTSEEAGSILINKITNTEWVNAVDPNALVNNNNEEQKMLRAESIIENLVATPMTNMNFLDFGCGEGHVAYKMQEKSPKISVGYDIRQTGGLMWEAQQDNKCLLTTRWEEVLNNAPYDYILLYDVLDHIENTTIDAVLNNIKKISKANTIIRLRVHPWSSRHGGHVYTQYNKAFAHLCLKEPELRSLNHIIMPNQFLTNEEQYNNYFKNVGFTILDKDITEEEVEPLFTTSPYINRISETLQMPKKTALESLRLSFIDYVLKI